MLSNNIIGERLKECRKAKKENQEDIAKILNVQRQIISYYETGTRTPNIDDLAKLAEHFDTSVDYLIGLSKSKSRNPKINAVCDYTGLSELSIEKIAEWKKQKFSYYYGYHSSYTTYQKLNFFDNFISSEYFDDVFSFAVKYTSELSQIEDDIYEIINSKIDLDVDVFNSLDEINSRFRAARCDYYDCIGKFESYINAQTEELYNRVDELLKNAFQFYGFEENNNNVDGDI
ncbi:MAG: helix-turn-helix domain-containing protein [Acutalibacteraceae bacterium]